MGPGNNLNYNQLVYTIVIDIFVIMKYEIEQCLGARINGLSRRIDNIYRRHLKDKGVTQSQLSIMLALYKMGESEQHVVAGTLNFETSSLTRILVRLMNQKYIIKTGAVNRPSIALTKLGVKKVKEVLPNWENAMDEVHEILGEKSVKAFSAFEKGFK